MKTRKIPLLVFAFSACAVLFSALFSHKAVASGDNNLSPANVQCTISIKDGVTGKDVALPTSESTAFADSTSPISPTRNCTLAGCSGKYVYEIKVCGDTSISGGAPLVASVQDRTTTFANWGSTGVFTDVGNGCFQGNIIQNSNTPYKYAIDIETQNGTHVCPRTYTKLQGGSTNERKDWDDAISQMCKSLKIQPSLQVSTAMDVTVSFDFPERLHGSPGSDYLGRGFRICYPNPLKSAFGCAAIPGDKTHYDLTYKAGTFLPGTYTSTFHFDNIPVDSSTSTDLCPKTLIVCTPENLKNNNCKAVTSGGGDTTFDLCQQAATTDQEKCNICVKKNSIWTAIGCVPTDAQGIVQSLLRIGLGLSGGVVILAILAGAFMFATSSGDTKKVQEAQEMISSAIIGLLFVIFSVVILQFVGVSLLHIPGFGK